MKRKTIINFIYSLLWSKIIIRLIFLYICFGCCFLAYSESQFDKKFIVSWILLLVVAFFTIIFKIEMRNKQRIKTDKTGVFNSEEILEFYEDF